MNVAQRVLGLVHRAAARAHLAVVFLRADERVTNFPIDAARRPTGHEPSAKPGDGTGPTRDWIAPAEAGKTSETEI